MIQRHGNNERFPVDERNMETSQAIHNLGRHGIYSVGSRNHMVHGTRHGKAGLPLAVVPGPTIPFLF